MNAQRLFFGGILAVFTSLAAANSSLFLAFTPDPARSTPLISPEGCNIEYEPRGLLAPPTEGGTCRSGELGPTVVGQNSGAVRIPAYAEFTSAPFAQAFEIGGATTVRVYYVSHVQTETDLWYYLHEIRSNGKEIAISDGVAVEGISSSQPPACCEAQSGTFEIKPYLLSAGSQLHLRLRPITAVASNGSLLFGGDSLIGGRFGDAGITFTVREPGESKLAADGTEFAEGRSLLAGAFDGGFFILQLLATFARSSRQNLS